ncbi:MAG: hypothetical protein AAB756_00090, partial [Patescibacteria group bacterium]
MDTKDVFEILRHNPTVQGLKNEFNVPYRNVFVAIMVLHPDDPTKVLVIDYKRDWKKSEVDIKFPGGTGEDEDKTPFHTTLREGKAEVLAGTPGAMIEGVFPICKEVKPARSARETDHARYGTVVQTNMLILPYVVREGRHIDERGRWSDEEIGNHRYLPIGVLAGEVFRGHRGFLREICRILAPHILEYGWVFQELGRDRQGDRRSTVFVGHARFLEVFQRLPPRLHRGPGRADGGLDGGVRAFHAP